MNDKVEAIPEEAMRFADLWFHLQELKKKMRRQFIEDFKTMISKNASTEELLDRLLKHERARRTTRDAHNVATENTAAEPTYWQLVRDLEDYGIPPEYKAHVLFCRPLTPEEQAEIENWQAMLDEGLSEPPATMLSRIALSRPHHRNGLPTVCDGGASKLRR